MLLLRFSRSRLASRTVAERGNVEMGNDLLLIGPRSRDIVLHPYDTVFGSPRSQTPVSAARGAPPAHFVVNPRGCLDIAYDRGNIGARSASSDVAGAPVAR
jgi:hypothetical protein